MADDWFKLNMDIFGNRKIKYLRRLPNGDSIALFWIVLLAEARRCNSDGKIFLTENFPYTPAMLAEDFQFEESTVNAALDAFNQLGMIYTNNGFITIAGWEDHQNAEGLAKIREQNRLRQAKFKAKQQASPDNADGNASVTLPVTLPVTLGNATEEEKEEDKELDLDNKKESVTCKQVVALYHEICISYPRIRSLSEARKKAIKARLNTYSLDDFKKAFENAEASSFLKGRNDRNWTATFDWLIKDNNMAKVLEGNYADKGRKEMIPKWCGANGGLGDAELSNIQRLLNEDKPTVGSDPELANRAEQLRQRLGG